MILYVDSSVVLRLLLRQRGALPEPRHAELILGSALIGLECWRTLDRLRLRSHLSEAALARMGEALQRRLDALELISVTEVVLEQAARPMPVALGSLDAIHLATALLWQQTQQRPVVMATHDRQLALASRALGLTVVGSEAR